MIDILFVADLSMGLGSVKCFGVIIYVRFRSPGGKETGAPETVHQRKHTHINNGDDNTRTGGGGQTQYFGALPRELNY